ncbi:MAG: potassium-transporting ATPase subunit C [Chitinophagaceae bacterium]
MKKQILSSLVLSLLCALLLCVLYPALLLVVAKASAGGGNGVTIQHSGKRYYIAVAQRFSEDRYFWPRPSAVDYNASGSGGSNKGPFNKLYLKLVQQRIDSFLIHNPGAIKAQIPSELVTASGSGLDPDISYEAAMIQVKRVAAARNVSEKRIKSMIQDHCSRSLLGPAIINVLLLNIALDRMAYNDNLKK